MLRPSLADFLLFAAHLFRPVDSWRLETLPSWAHDAIVGVVYENSAYPSAGDMAISVAEFSPGDRGDLAVGAFRVSGEDREEHLRDGAVGERDGVGEVGGCWVGTFDAVALIGFSGRASFRWQGDGAEI